jgi:HSP20 family protein
MLVVRPTVRPYKRVHTRPVYSTPRVTNNHNHIGVNVIEREDAYHLELAAPGLNKKDFDLSVENEVLTISAKKESAKEEGVKVLRKEFGQYNFKRSFELAETIDANNIRASYEQGILKVVLPKKEKEAPKVVTVK